MEILSVSTLALAVPAVVFAGISKGGFGSNAAFAAASILALVVEPGVALGVMLPLLMLMDVAALRPYWGKWAWRESFLLMVGGVPGVVIGAALWQVASPDVFRFLIGAIAVLFVIWQLGLARGIFRPASRPLPDWVGYLAGIAAGFTSFISHAGGPPASAFLLSRDTTKTEYQASTVLVFWIINIAKAIPYGFLGIFTYHTLLADLILAPFAILGTWVGVWLHNVVPEKAFFALTYVLLLVTGTKLIFDALT